jgi:hypothetical protein
LSLSVLARSAGTKRTGRRAGTPGESARESGRACISERIPALVEGSARWPQIAGRFDARAAPIASRLAALARTPFRNRSR